MLSRKQISIFATVLFIVVVGPDKVNLLEYGQNCTIDSQCIAQDFRDPLICTPPSTPTTTTVPPTETPTTTTTTEDPTTTVAPTTTTEDPTTTVAPTTTTEDPTTTVAPTTTTEDPTTTLAPTTTTEDPTTTLAPTTTTEDPTTTLAPTTTTEDPTTTLAPTKEDPLKTIVDNNDTYDYDWYAVDRVYDNAINTMDSKYQVLLQQDEVGRCGCVPGTFRHEELNRCVSPPSGVCDLKVSDGGAMRTCTKFASCFPPTTNSTEGTCYCDADGVENSNTGHCLLTHGSTKCEQRTDCDIYNLLTCRNGTCVCEYETIQRWNPDKDACGYIVGVSCSKSDTPYPNPICVEHAVCNSDEICQCEQGFKETLGKECKLPYNGTCETQSDCHPDFICSNNTCMCPEGLLYFGSTERCHLPEGFQCDAADATDICTMGSQCVNGTCICETGYESSSEHACEALHGSKCSAEISCHEESFLDNCSGSGVCECKSNYNYHQTRCVGNIDEVCNEDEDCIDHAVCEGKCTCGGNYLPGDDKKSCFTRYGQPCDILDCFPDHYLKCDENRTCSCANPQDQTYDDARDRCVALEGRPCYGSAGGIECVESAVCDAQQDGVTKCQCNAGYSSNSTGYCIQAASSTSKIRGVYGLIAFFTIFLTIAKGSLL